MNSNKLITIRWDSISNSANRYDISLKERIQIYEKLERKWSESSDIERNILTTFVRKQLKK